MLALFGKSDPKPPAGAPKPAEGSSTQPAPAGNQGGAASAAPSTPPPPAPDAPKPGEDGSTPPASTGSKAASAKLIAGLAVRAIPEGGFCRAGRRWSTETQVVAVSEFTEAQIQALRDEVNLDVADVDITPSGPEA